MSAIYIHVPFCASRCIYCDFYSTTLHNKAHEYVNALINELNTRSDFLPNGEPLRTVYIGGGTPSQLPPEEVTRLLNAIWAQYNTNNVTEVTIEANPEDITEEYCAKLDKRISRVSMGVQSLIDSELKMLNRRHDSKRASEAVKLLRRHGIKNISLDLMYGLPNQTLESWGKSIDGIIALEPQHISAYCLSVEEGTQMHKLVQNGKLTPADDEMCLRMASLLREKLKRSGYEQYEISNYARQGFESQHNSSYWAATPYLGLGPGAHSYDGERLRTWNDPDVISYINGKRKFGSEQLSDKDIYNEMIMLGLRTAIGIDESKFKIREKLVTERVDSNRLAADESSIDAIVSDLISRNLIHRKNNHLILTEAGLALADEVIRELML